MRVSLVSQVRFTAQSFGALNEIISLDFLPRPRQSSTSIRDTHKPLLPWLIRRVECVRGKVPLLMQCAPAFNYARSTHVTTLVEDTSIPFGPKQLKAVFDSDSLSLDLRYVVESAEEHTQVQPKAVIELIDLSEKGHKGLGVQSAFTLSEGQIVTFILRTPPTEVIRAPVSGQNQALSTVELDAKARSQAEHSLEVRKGAAELVAERDASIVNTPRSRALDDPFLTKELIHSLLHVSTGTSLFSCQALFNNHFRTPIITGMIGSANPLTRALGRSLSIAAPWR